MPLSISSSDPGAWRRFLLTAVGSAVGLATAMFAFVAIVDPWDILPLSPQLDRAQVTSNQRFAYPTLARSPAFDSAVFGSSAVRLLRPALLNEQFGGRFVNLAMNAAT